MKVQITARLFDTCHGDFVTDWSGVVVGIPLNGQDVATMADDVARDATFDCYTSDSVLDDHVLASITDDMVRDAIVACLKPDARFWPVDHGGNEIAEWPDDDNQDSWNNDLQEEQPCAWFRLTIEHDCTIPGDDPDVDTAIADGLCRIGEILGTAIAIALFLAA